MDIKGKITIFPELKERETEKGVESFIAVRGTISTTKKDSGEYINKSVTIRFAGSNFPAEKVNKLSPEKCYKLDVEEGFLSVEEFPVARGTRRELVFVVLKGKLSDPKVVERPVVEEKATDEDLPF